MQKQKNLKMEEIKAYKSSLTNKIFLTREEVQKDDEEVINSEIYESVYKSDATGETCIDVEDLLTLMTKFPNKTVLRHLKEYI